MGFALKRKVFFMKKNIRQDFKKGDIIRLFKSSGSGRWTRYSAAVKPDILEVLKFAGKKGLALAENDAPRGGKLGAHFKILKDFSADALVRELAEDRAARAAAEEAKAAEIRKALKHVLNSELVESFVTISDVGSFLIAGQKYNNFYGDGENAVEVCKCNFEDFKKSELITKRQVFAAREPLTVVKFEEPKDMTVSLQDCGEGGVKLIKNACGFAIWERKLKIFTVA